MSVDALLKEVEGLSETDRVEFLERLDARYRAPASELSPELAKLLDERIAAADANPDAAIPWEQVYRESLKRVRQ